MLWFPGTLARLEARAPTLAAREDARGLWICWPKKASGVATDLTQDDVRRVGLAHGLVDYKVAAIDATYTGLKFAWRGRKR